MTLMPLGDGWNDRITAQFEAAGLAASAPELLTPLADLLDQVVIWNRRHNLTAARGPDELADLYLADALWLTRIGSGCGGKWLDVGSGGGAPGLGLALLRPRLVLELVEPRDKRVAFLRTMIGRWELPRVTVLRCRSDALPAQSVDVALARATLPPPAWLAEGARLARRVVWVLLAREPAPSHEGWRLVHQERYAWPLTGFERTLARYEPEASG